MSQSQEMGVEQIYFTASLMTNIHNGQIFNKLDQHGNKWQDRLYYSTTRGIIDTDTYFFNGLATMTIVHRQYSYKIVLSLYVLGSVACCVWSSLSV